MSFSKLTSKNPATGDTLAEIDPTPHENLPTLFARARTAQKVWATRSVGARTEILLQIREALINQADEVAALISRENGKPLFEALSNEVLPCVELLTFFASHSERVLEDQNIPMGLMRHRESYLNHWPLGVVAVISPWNYPFLLPFGEIMMALVTGNAVIFKPSEITPLIGLKIQDLCETAGLPHDLLQTVIGDGATGAAIIQQRPNKIFFTGSVATGKKIMAASAEHLIPLALELGGKDAMIVLPDADLDFATSAALWGGFSNSGQVCASVERLLVHENIAEKFTALLTEKMGKLRQNPSDLNETDLGVITFEKQKTIYESQLKEAADKGAKITGGVFNSMHTALQPTLVTGKDIEALEIYNEETFGPVIALTTFKSVQEAIEKANNSKYGLLASVITRDLALGESIAKQLEVGTVTINEVTYTAGLPETPWGGVKNSGFGRKHSEMGLLEFVNIRHIHKPRVSAFVFKSFWWFPYTPFQHQTFRQMLELYRRSWYRKAKALPHFIWNFTQFIKNERRL